MPSFNFWVKLLGLGNKVAGIGDINGDGYADIAAGVSLYRWTTMEIERSGFANVEAWHKRLGERAAFRKAVNVDYEELRMR